MSDNYSELQNTYIDISNAVSAALNSNGFMIKQQVIDDATGYNLIEYTDYDSVDIKLELHLDNDVISIEGSKSSSGFEDILQPIHSDDIWNSSTIEIVSAVLSYIN